MTGRLVGNYTVECKLGEGAIGIVYKGVDLALGRKAALKLIRPELSRVPQIAERFRAQAVSPPRFEHPNIGSLYGLLCDGDDLWLILELAGGETLDQFVVRTGPAAPAKILPLFTELLDGFEHAHRQGFVHRDIK